MSNSQMSDADSDPERISEADAVSDDGTRYRTLTANKSGETTDDS